MKASMLSFLLSVTRVELDVVSTPTLQYLDGSRLSQVVP